VDFVWFHMVRLGHAVGLVIRVTELSVLVWITFAPPQTPCGLRFSWSILAVTSTRSALKEMSELVGYHRCLGDMKSYLGNLWNYVELIADGLFLALIWSAKLNGFAFSSRPLLAVVSFLRWIQMLYNMGVYRCLDIGFKIVPIFQSFFQVTGIALITLFTFLAFLHAFAALDDPEELSVSDLLLNVFKLLLVGDGDGINYVLSLGGRPDNGALATRALLYFGVIIFCVCILNLFIAVHGNAYDVEKSRVVESFYCNRAWVCLVGMLQPRCRCSLPMPSLLCYLLMQCVGIPVWAGLLYSPIHPTFGSAWLLVSLSLGDAVLRKRPWNEQKGKPSLGSARRFKREVAPAPNSPHASLSPFCGFRGEESRSSKLAARKESQGQEGPCSAATPLNPDPDSPQHFLWWCSWADDVESPSQQGERGGESALTDGLFQVTSSAMTNLGHRFDDHLQNVHALQVRMQRFEMDLDKTRDTTAQTVVSLQSHLDSTVVSLQSRLDGVCRCFEGLDERMNGLEAHLLRAERSLSRIAGCLGQSPPFDTTLSPHSTLSVGASASAFTARDGSPERCATCKALVMDNEGAVTDVMNQSGHSCGSSPRGSHKTSGGSPRGSHKRRVRPSGGAEVGGTAPGGRLGSEGNAGGGSPTSALQRLNARGVVLPALVTRGSRLGSVDGCSSVGRAAGPDRGSAGEGQGQGGSVSVVRFAQDVADQANGLHGECPGGAVASGDLGQRDRGEGRAGSEGQAVGAPQAPGNAGDVVPKLWLPVVWGA